MFLLWLLIERDIKMAPVSRFHHSVDIAQEAKRQDAARLENDQLDDYRITGIKPQSTIEDSPFVEDDSSIFGSFDEIMERRRRVAQIQANEKLKPLLDKCMDIDIEEWDRLMEEYKETMSDPFFGLEL